VSTPAEASSPHASRFVFDALVIGWVALWIVLGVVTANQVRSLTSVTDTIDLSATTVDRTADALDPLAQLPFIGTRVREAQTRIRSAAREARGNAAESRTSIENLSWLLGLAVAVAPSVPIAAGYTAFRAIGVTRRRRQRRGHGMDEIDRDPALPAEVGL
jgi:hypothetical protein